MVRGQGKPKENPVEGNVGGTLNPRLQILKGLVAKEPMEASMLLSVIYMKGHWGRSTRLWHPSSLRIREGLMPPYHA